MPVIKENRKFDRKSAPEIDRAAFRHALLGWYDRAGRVLPWRVKGKRGQRQNPYYVWLSEVMLQQTTVQAVIPYFNKFTTQWPDVHGLAGARDDDVMAAWAGLGYYARARNLLKCARAVVADHGGVFPDTLDGLKGLPGIGDYTAAAISAIAYDHPVTVIDGNVDRVISRVYQIETPLPDSKPMIRSLAPRLFEGAAGEIERPGDFAQAMMDLGATICIPKTPRCALCPVSGFCRGYASGLAAELPYKKEKAPRPRRAGYIFYISDKNGRVLLEKRPERGLLGGMTAFPTSEWVDHKDFKALAPDYPAGLTIGDIGRKAVVRHVFTHFELELYPVTVIAGRAFCPAAGQFWAEVSDLGGIGLPTVFKKFLPFVVDKRAKI